ncbi:hypothetical protein C8Q73DRAFT_316066 [Cubamyces lactineus]|nr:hypothetical protein C8Q73DRAFT_316066 [Cubamyces lactineus]
MSETAANAETELGTQQDPAATSTPAEPGNVTVSGEPLTPAHAAPKPERPTPRSTGLTMTTKTRMMRTTTSSSPADRVLMQLQEASPRAAVPGKPTQSTKLPHAPLPASPESTVNITLEMTALLIILQLYYGSVTRMDEAMPWKEVERSPVLSLRALEGTRSALVSIPPHTLPNTGTARELWVHYETFLCTGCGGSMHSSLSHLRVRQYNEPHRTHGIQVAVDSA